MTDNFFRFVGIKRPFMKILNTADAQFGYLNTRIPEFCIFHKHSILSEFKFFIPTANGPFYPKFIFSCFFISAETKR